MNPNSYKIIIFPGHELPATYKNLVSSRWARSLKFGSDLFKLIDAKAYWAIYPKLIDVILLRPQTTVSLAVLADDEDNVLGFAIHEGEETLHYVQVDSHQRKSGIGKSLVKPTVLAITHITRQGIPFWVSVLPNAKFNPFRA